MYSNDQHFNLLGILLLLLINTPVLAFKSADYIYIDASEGNASGGHVAIRFDDDVYHYQYVDPGLIRLEKQTVNDFEFNYRFLENRSLYLSQLALSEKTYTQLRDHFDFRFQIQKQHYAILTELSREQMLLQYLSGHPINKPELLKLPGAGLFYSEQNFGENLQIMPLTNKGKVSSILTKVQKKIQSHYGSDYIERRLQTLVKHIEQIQPTQWTEQSIKLQEKQLPSITYTFANRYLDAMTAWVALKTILQQRPLRPDAYHTSDYDDFSLSTDQLAAMQRFSVVLQDNILHLLQSSRPDWGSALLINLGRLLVLDQSIKQQKLVVLNNTASTSEEFNQDELLALYQESIKNLHQVKRQFKKQGRRQEVLYSQLEWQANHFLALNKAKKEQGVVQLPGVKQIPDNPLTLPKIIMPQLEKRQLQVGLQNIQKVTSLYKKELDHLYHYNLFQKNCVTELFVTIDQAIFNESIYKNTTEMTNKKVKQQSIDQLGGYVSMDSLNFIPFLSHQAVQNQYQISEQRTLPSYRLHQLQNLYSQENKGSVFFRESNTFSSSLYKINSADSFFVFFTDETILLRPLYGIVNTLAGLGQSIFGLFSFPFDSGQHLQSGAKGIMMSLPELVFFNMRKGSFNHLPYNKMLAADETIAQKFCTHKPSSTFKAIQC